MEIFRVVIKSERRESRATNRSREISGKGEATLKNWKTQQQTKRERRERERGGWGRGWSEECLPSRSTNPVNRIPLKP